MPTQTLQATPTEDPIQHQCRHIRPDGHRCGSPSLRLQNFCFYHDRARRPGPRQPQVTTATARKASTFDLPSPADLADRAGLQLALALLLHKIAHNEIDPRRAGLLLYGLQTAAMLLPKEPRIIKKGGRSSQWGRDGESHTSSQAGPVEDIIDDPVHGPLAPEAEVGDNEPESVLAGWVRQVRERKEATRLAKEAEAAQAASAQAQAQAAAGVASAAGEAEAATATTTAKPTTQPASTQPRTRGVYIPPSCFALNAAAAATHRPNRACRRQAGKHQRRQQTTPQARKLANPRTRQPANPRTRQPANPPTRKPANSQTR